MVISDESQKSIGATIRIPGASHITGYYDARFIRGGASNSVPIMMVKNFTSYGGGSSQYQRLRKTIAFSMIYIRLEVILKTSVGK